MSKKLISLLLSLLLVLGTVGVPVGAAAGDPVTITLMNTINDKMITSITAKAGDPYIIYMNNVSDPSQTGYNFIGWSATKGGAKIDMTSSIPDTSFTFLYTIWEAKDVSVTFNNGYGGTVETKPLKYDSAYQLPSDPSRPGYTFAGWFTAASGGTEVTDKTIVQNANNHTIYARWTNITYTVKLFDNLNGPSPNVDRTVTVAYNTKVGSITKPTKTGYTCTWKSGGSSVSDDTLITKDMELSAEWTPAKYTISFNANGGTFTTTPSSVDVDYGSKYSDAIKNISEPTRDGYTFKGWSTSSNGAILDKDATVTGTQTLFAVWEGKSETIKLDKNLPTNCGSAPTTPNDNATISVTYGEKIAGLPTPSPLPTYTNINGTVTTKYGFAGWYTTAKDEEYDPEDPDKKLTLGKPVANGDPYNGGFTEVYARWKYKVTFDPVNPDGTVTTTEKEVISGTEMGVLPTPSCPGYKFMGWYTRNGFREDQKVTAYTIANPDALNGMMLYAKFEPEEYEVTLNANGGDFADGAINKLTVTYKVEYAGLEKCPIPTRIGYKFAGWYKSEKPADGEKPITESSIVNETKDHILYAQWEPNAVTLSLDYHLPDGFDTSTYKAPELTNDQIFIDQTFTVTGLPAAPPSFTYDGVTYTFADWYTTAEDSDPTSPGKQVNRLTPLTADMVGNSNSMTLHARWKFNVGFCENPKSTSPTKSVPCITGSTYGTRLYTPTRTGYTFMGWYTVPIEDDAVITVPRVLDTDVASANDLKLYAAWSTSEYVVTPDANGGTFSPIQTIPWAFSHGDTYGKYVTEPEYIPAAREGYTFDGWYTEEEGGTKLTATTKVTESCTIYAHWKADQFKVTLKLGYTGASDVVKTVDYDTELGTVLPDPEPERTGYAFDGWFNDEKFLTKADVKLKVHEDVTLYAKWTEAKRVELVVGGGTLPAGATPYINVYEGGNYGKLPTPTWMGCTFGGWWTTEKTGGRRVNNADVITSKKDIPDTLYARWTPKKVTVNFNYNGANLNREPQQYDVGSTYNRLPTYAAWAGHEFMGWYTKAVGGEKVDSSTTVSVTSDREEDLYITLYAHWGYTVVFDPGDGLGEMEKQIAEMDQPYTLPTCTFTPPDGMRFGGWAIATPDGPTQPGGSQYTVIRNLTLYATWTTAPITITASCTSGGSLMTEDGKSNTVSVERGKDVTFIATANTGYVLKELMVDGVNFNYTDVYTFRDVIEDHTIHAIFERVGAPAYSTCTHGTSCPLAGYSDLNPNQWYHDGVHFCIDNVLMGGTSSTRFVPGNNSTRGELAVSLWNYAGRPDVGGSGPLNKTYTDVKTSDWYYQAVEWATKQNILAGYGNGKFGPNDPITREQLVAILWRHAGMPSPRSNTLRFYDSSKVSSYAWEAMCWATEQGILQGRSTGYLVPRGTATRAEVATMLKNYLG